MIRLVPVTTEVHLAEVRRLFEEFILWSNERAGLELGISLEIEPTLNRLMGGINEYYPPRGRFYLVEWEGGFRGVGGLRLLSEDIAEVKRMFVQPAYHGKGLGSALLDRLIEDARAMGCIKVRLDTAVISRKAHGLYRSRGFKTIGPYPGSEGAEFYPDYFLFMELDL